VPPEGNGAGRRRVVIVGAGFGGLAAANRLRHADVDVTLVDRVNHHLFQPLLYQAALGGLSESDCASPIRASLGRAANTRLVMAEVTDVDAERKQVVLDRGERLDYDSLIVACGAQTSYFGHDEWQAVSCGLKTLADVVDLRSRYFAAFEEAERAEDEATRAAWLTFVIIGGGPTGVEVAGQLAITARVMKHGFQRVDPAQARVILLDAGDRLVAAFSPKLSGKVSDGLEELGVTVREGARATALDARGVTIRVGDADERIDSRTVIWAAGVHAVPLTEALARATGASTDRGGRIQVTPELTVPGHAEISVIGDVASLEGPGGKPLPGLATVAIQQAHHVAKGIRGGAAAATTPFKYLDKGALAVVGRNRAVCEIRGLKLWGPPAFLTYLAVHLYYLGGPRGRRVEVLMKSIGARFGQRQSALIASDPRVSSACRQALSPSHDPGSLRGAVRDCPRRPAGDGRRGRRRPARVPCGRARAARRLRARRDEQLRPRSGPDPVAQPNRGRALRVPGRDASAAARRRSRAGRDPRARALGDLDGGRARAASRGHGSPPPSPAGLPLRARPERRVPPLGTRDAGADLGHQRRR
jgi:NADH:ubiquinone reductase (H+-translocating)